MLECHVIIYDTRSRYIDLRSEFAKGPQWSKVSDWEKSIDPEGIKCSAGWTSIHTQYYRALLGLCAVDDSRTLNSGLFLQDQGVGLDGVSNPIVEIPLWLEPLPRPAGGCILI